MKVQSLHKNRVGAAGYYIPEGETGITIRGTSLSPGLAEGKIHIYQSSLDPTYVVYDTSGHHNIEKELNQLDRATMQITDDLFELTKRVGKEIDKKLSKVFETHQLMVNDSSLKEELRREIVENLESASSAVKTVLLRWEKRFLLMESQIARNKSEDIKDICLRLSNALVGITAHPLEKIPPHCVLAISRLLPSDTVFLFDHDTKAVLLEYGSAGSHAALFAREFGLPCISGIANQQTTLRNGDWALVDADAGTVIIRPYKKQINRFKKNVFYKEEAIHLAHTHALESAVTKDGIKTTVLANVGCDEDTRRAMRNGAEGVGLYRMERAYLANAAPPSVDELLNEMRRTLEPVKGRVVCVRLLDIGGDKPLPFLKFMAETNPSMGRRGIRLLCEFPELLKTHLQAILELSGDFDVSILIPMVTLPDEASFVKHHLTQLGSQLSMRALPKLGAMIETPAAALSAQEIAGHVDFLSFGTNDLTQYAFAADRDNASVERYFNDTSGVIFRMLRMVHEDVPGMPLSICGELAGRSQYIPQLLQCGIRTFSVAPSLIPIIKEAIRNSSLTESLYEKTTVTSDVKTTYADAPSPPFLFEQEVI